MANRTVPISNEERGEPLGDTGDGKTGVPSDAVWAHITRGARVTVNAHCSGR
jgi:hypothetical protein